MNLNQRIVIIVGIIFMLVIVVYPLWIFIIKTKEVSSEEPAGYHLIFKPPDPPKENIGERTMRAHYAATGREFTVAYIVSNWILPESLFN